jgi:uncharacterized membrane protein
LVFISASYFSFDTNFHFLKAKQDLLPNKIWLSNFYLHLAGGIVAVLSGLCLFFDRLIPFRSTLHKLLGRTYVIAVMLISGPTGFYLAFFSEGGALATVGFLLMSTLWMVITYVALNKILKGDIDGHNKWMIRSFCFTLSGVTLRIMTPLGISIFNFDYDTNFILSAFIPWMFNMAIAELILIYQKNNYKKQTVSSAVI